MPSIPEEVDDTYQGVDWHSSHCLVWLMPSVPEEADDTRQGVCCRSVNCAARGGKPERTTIQVQMSDYRSSH